MTAVPARREDYTVGEEVLKHLNLDPHLPEVKALVLLCERYGLDPLLDHADIIKHQPYITRDGYLDIAHRSGQLDGIVVDELRRNSGGDGWTAYVSVYRKDMSHPFRYGAQCRDKERQAQEGYGPEQAVARAERRSLKRAFNIQAVDPIDPGDSEIVQVEAEPARALEPEEMSSARASPTELAADGRAPDAHADDPEPEPEPPPDVVSGELTQSEAHAVIRSLPKAQQIEFLQRHRIAEFKNPWPYAALVDAAREAEKPF